MYGSPCFRDQYLRLKQVIQSFRAGNRGRSLEITTPPPLSKMKKPADCKTPSIMSMNSHQTGALLEYTLVVVPLIILTFWSLVHHDSIAVSKSLLLLLAMELEAAGLALARMSLSLFPKTSFTATQTGNCLYVTLPEERGVQQGQPGEHHGMEILTWCGFKALTPSTELKLKVRTIACTWYFNYKSCYFSSRASRHFLCIIPVPKYCKIDEVWRAHH